MKFDFLNNSDHKISFNRKENNFDLLRLIFSLMVILGHSQFLLTGKPINNDFFLAITGVKITRLAVICFFITSGILVTYSLENSKNRISFSIKRLLRIYPPVFILILFTIFIVGPLTTSISINNYFLHQQTILYSENIFIFRMYYYLPGVFSENPTNAVNGSLWTLSYELFSYLILLSLSFIKGVKLKDIILVIFIFLIILQQIIPSKIDQFVFPFLGVDFKNFLGLFIYFIAGSLLYYNSIKIPRSITLLILLIAILYVIQLYKPLNIIQYVIIPLIVFQLGFSKSIIRIKYDLSYSLYIYAYLIQQCLIFLFGNRLDTLMFFFLTIVVCLPFAFASHIYIEKPFIKIGRKF